MTQRAVVFCAGLAGSVLIGLTAHAELLPVPNASFESPELTFFFGQNIDSWQKNPKPPEFIENFPGEWDTQIGVFENEPPENLEEHIGNMEGNQAIWVFAVPGAGLSLDYHSIDYNDEIASHNFDVTFDPGRGYRLTVGVLGGGGGQGTPKMKEGVPLELSLYYHDEQTNVITVATTTVTHSEALFPTRTNLVDFHVDVPIVTGVDAWAGKRIGIGIHSTVGEELQGSYWDLDNVRLRAIPPPTLVNPEMTDAGFVFTLQSAPGAEFDLLASPDPALPIGEWSAILSITNDTGSISVTNEPAGAQQFYQLRQLP